jgi:shikimate kinase
VILRLLSEPVHVLATGGGAFMDAEIRAAVKARGISVWLRADLELLLRRVSRRTDRPLLKGGDPREILERLMATRYPVYAEADVAVDSLDGPPEAMVDAVLAALAGCPAMRAADARIEVPS